MPQSALDLETLLDGVQESRCDPQGEALCRSLDLLVAGGARNFNFDRAIVVGLTFATVRSEVPLDRVALAWLERAPTDLRVDALGGLLQGLWRSGCGLDPDEIARLRRIADEPDRAPDCRQSIATAFLRRRAP